MIVLSTEQAIHNLLFRYAELVDLGRFDEVGELFARGDYKMRGAAGSRGSAVADAMRATVRTYDGGRPGTKHVMTNAILEPTGDASVDARSCFTVIQAVDGFALQPIIAGRYEDTFGRDDDGWYFTSRTITIDLVGDLSRHLRISLSAT